MKRIYTIKRVGLSLPIQNNPKKRMGIIKSNLANFYNATLAISILNEKSKKDPISDQLLGIYSKTDPGKEIDFILLNFSCLLLFFIENVWSINFISGNSYTTRSSSLGFIYRLFIKK